MGNVMKKLLLFAALLPAMAFAQQPKIIHAAPGQTVNVAPGQTADISITTGDSPDASATSDQLAALMAATAPNSGLFPASCLSDMANVQLAQMVQVYAGNPMGDELVDFRVTQGIGTPSHAGYNCLVVATWRDHGVQHGVAGIFKGPGQSVIYQWRPLGY